MSSSVIMHAKIGHFLDKFLTLGALPNAENLYDATPHGQLRRHNVELYLRLMMVERPEVLIIGEAPGYQGTCRTGVPFASEFMSLFNTHQVLALGNVAHRTLATMGLEVPKIRHPSHGGAKRFAQQLFEIVPKKSTELPLGS